tara:strand:- start:534 stop:815 length:282 start_codon:yes stop_codon:yes gene_type:complete
MGVDGADNSRISSNWDHTKNWKKMRDRQEKIKKGLKSGRSLQSLWKPTEEGSAGKGSRPRPVDKEIYDLNYDLAFGNITKEEHTIRMEELEGQ